MSYTIKLDDGKFASRLAAWRKGLAPAKIADIGGRYMALTHLPGMFEDGGPGWPAVKRGGLPLWDVGTLASSFYWQVSGTTAEIMNRQKYAITHDKGLTITAKNAYLKPMTRRGPKGTRVPLEGFNGPYLRIPLSPPLSVSQRRLPKSVSLKGTFMVRSRKGNWTICRKVGKGVEAIFLLTKSVKITARPFMFWSRAAIDGTIEAIQAIVSIEKAKA